MSLALPILILAATLSFALGIVLPLLQVDRLYFFTEEPSLLQIVAALWGEGDRLLAAVVALFSIAFPAVKLALLHIGAYAGGHARPQVPEWFRAVSNWSMLDVVLVALVIFAAKTSGLATAFTKPGLWFFAASVISTAAASRIVKRRRERGGS